MIRIKEDKMKHVKNKKNIAGIFARYLIILAFGAGNLWIFYRIFTPLTLYSTSFALNFFSDATINGNVIIFKSLFIELIPACVAGSAYYFLLLLIMATPEINYKKRIKIILFSFAVFFVLNIIRIASLALIINSSYFNALHMILWYILSTLFVVGIWLADIKIFRIKAIPFYDDFKFIRKMIKIKK